RPSRQCNKSGIKLPVHLQEVTERDRPPVLLGQPFGADQHGPLPPQGLAVEQRPDLPRPKFLGPPADRLPAQVEEGVAVLPVQRVRVGVQGYGGEEEKVEATDPGRPPLPPRGPSSGGPPLKGHFLKPPPKQHPRARAPLHRFPPLALESRQQLA